MRGSFQWHIPVLSQLWEVHIFFWKGDFFRAAQVEKVESLGAAKAKNRGGGGCVGGWLGFPVAHTRTVPIWE